MLDEALPSYCVGSAHIELWSCLHAEMPSEQHVLKAICVHQDSEIL